MSKKKVGVCPAAPNTVRKKHHFRVQDHFTYKIGEKKDTIIANFVLRITSQILIIDGDREKEKLFEINVEKPGNTAHFVISIRDFFGSNLLTRIIIEAGPEAVLYGTAKDLRAAALELSGPNIPVKKIFASPGFDPDGNYHSQKMLITPQGIRKKPDPGLDLYMESVSRNLEFLSPQKDRLQALGKTILSHFLELKPHEVTYPLAGHLALAPLASQIGELTGREKVAMHLQGPSGCGKTFLGQLALSFFGNFDGKITSWSSTANAIEAEGYQYRDSLFLVDDYKAAFVPPENIVRVFQGYADGHGRLRLKSNARVQDQRYIRGLLLSTGEDFVADIESVTGRTICLQVEPDKNEDAGRKCWERRHLFPMFLPGMIQMVISRPGWREDFKVFVERRVGEFARETNGLSNGLRIASNWALNVLGFHIFLAYLSTLGIVDRNQKRRMEREYIAIVRSYLQDQAARLENESPMEVFFRIMGQKMASAGACISGLNGEKSKDRGRAFGFVKGQSVLVLPDVAMEILSAHFRGVGQRMPFTKISLRNVLAQGGLIARPQEGRIAKQVRWEDGKRVQVWDFDLEGFRKKIALI